ncbi:MAG: ketopantoate reductase family protein [Myxococcaceae bacterium]
MRMVILGAGAVGSVVAGFLTRSNREVVLLARGAQLATIRTHGLSVEAPEGSFVVHPPIADRLSPSEWRAGDVALLAVKTQDAASALRGLAAPRNVPVVCLTNGLEAERLSLRHVDEVYGACVNLPATYLLPGVVQAWASPVPGAIDLGRYPEGSGAHADAIRNELRAAGFASEVRTDVMRWKRGKLLSNLANGAEALCGPAARSSEAAELARREGLACFAAAGLSCTTLDEEEARGAGLQPKPIAGAVRGGGSTWQSLARGAASLETDYLNGEIALLGRLHGVPTPVNDLLQHLASEAARTGRKPGSMPLDDLLERVKSDSR